jgi:hypothetical protein
MSAEMDSYSYFFFISTILLMKHDCKRLKFIFKN